MGKLNKWFLGLLIIGILAAILEWFTPWGAKAHSVSMGNSIQTALESGGSTAKVEMHGNVAKLTGELNSDAARTSAIDIATNAQCESCNARKAGKRWHTVDSSALSVKELKVQPYTLSGVRTDDGGIRLDGFARTEQERDQILADAERFFPGQVIDDTIRIAGGAPNDNWRNVALANIAGLAKLETGRFAMKDTQTGLTGTTGDIAIHDGVTAGLNGLPAGYNSTVNIEVTQEAPVQITAVDACQGLFDTMKSKGKVNFATSSANIVGEDSLALLDGLASAAKQCSSFKITIGGHTDSSGRDDTNLDLSQRRANTVASYFVDKGVNEANISAIGYGETSPIANNQTREGRAKNRRIEFKVTRSK